MVSRNTLESLSERAARLQGNLATEEATKHALVLPFISALGYDIFDPTEVVPEFTADFGLKQGEKVDYAIMRSDKPAILFECKKASDVLRISSASQLARYFSATEARIGVLTNGVVYKFFSDLDSNNVMDSAPFLEIDFTSIHSRDLVALSHFTKLTFDAEEACAVAAEMKYIRGMKEYLAQAYSQPDASMVEFLARKVHSGRLTQSRAEHFTSLVKLAFQGFVNDRINDTLQRATDIAHTNLDSASAEPPNPPSATDHEGDDSEDDQAVKNIVTTVEELEGYNIVRTIVSSVVAPERVVMRDTRSYCSVLLDDNNRRALCRLRFNAKRVKYIELIEGRDERNHVITSFHRIDSLDDIYGYADQLRATAEGYLSEQGSK